MDSTNKYIEIEEKLLKAKSNLLRVSEQLSTSHVYQTEVISNRIGSVEQLSMEFELPYPVKGILLTEGRHKKKFYSAETLKNAALNPKNHKFKICQDHKNGETGAIIGAVEKIWYDVSLKGIMYKGHINNETAARNIDDGIITDASVTVFSKPVYTDNGLEGTELEFDELSTVIKGADPNASINPDK